MLLFATTIMIHLGALQPQALSFHVWIIRNLGFGNLGLLGLVVQVMLGSLFVCLVQIAAIQGSNVFQRGAKTVIWKNATLQCKCYCINQFTWISILWALGNFLWWECWVAASGQIVINESHLHCHDKVGKSHAELGCACSVLQSKSLWCNDRGLIGKVPITESPGCVPHASFSCPPLPLHPLLISN